MKLNDLSKKDLAVVGIRPLVDEATASAELADREAPKEAWEEEYWKEWGKLAGHPLANGLLGWIRSLISNQRRTIEHDKLLELCSTDKWNALSNVVRYLETLETTEELVRAVEEMKKGCADLEIPDAIRAGGKSFEVTYKEGHNSALNAVLSLLANRE